MIRKILSPVNQAITHMQDWADEKLRHLCGRMTPEIRLAVILLMLLFFGGLSIYFAVSSIYRIGKEDRRRQLCRWAWQAHLEKPYG